MDMIEVPFESYISVMLGSRTMNLLKEAIEKKQTVALTGGKEEDRKALKAYLEAHGCTVIEDQIVKVNIPNIVKEGM